MSHQIWFIADAVLNVFSISMMVWSVMSDQTPDISGR